MIVRITTGEYDRFDIIEVPISDLNDMVINHLNDNGLSIRYFSSNYIKYYINTETINYTGEVHTIKIVIKEAKLFKLSKRSNTIKELISKKTIK